MSIEIMELFRREVAKDRPISFVDDEAFVAFYYQEMGFVVKSGRSIDGETGTPDFFIDDKNGGFWVEVKNPNDGVRLSQIKWWLDNPTKKIILVVAHR